jgi:hypothetical protein
VPPLYQTDSRGRSRHLLNDKNVGALGGLLVVEIVPADEPGCTAGQPPKPAHGSYDYGVCTGANIAPPAIGAHVTVVGAYVRDEDHGWAEIHPAWSITPDGGVAQAVPALGAVATTLAGADAVLGAAFAPAPDPRFARSGAVFTRNVRQRTAILLLRLRYLLREQADEFAEEIVLTAFQRRDSQLSWLEPLGDAARSLLEQARPVGDMPLAERADHVAWTLDFLARDERWYAPILSGRVEQLQASHTRLRRLVKAGRLRIEPREPPDVLGCYVLVPAGGGG